MVAISSKYSFGADKAVQISQAVLLDKGTQPELQHKNWKITLLIWISDLHYEWIFWTQTFGKFQHCSTFYAHATNLFCLAVLTFSTVNIAINDNYCLWTYNLRMPIFKWFSLIEALVISQILVKFHENCNLKNKF